MWRRQAALALNGTAGIQASGKGPSSYTAQLPTPTGRSMQQGGGPTLKRAASPRDRRELKSPFCRQRAKRPDWVGAALAPNLGGIAWALLLDNTSRRIS